MRDTNGGSRPHQVQRIAGEVHAYFGADQQLGIHTQNDSGCAVANSVAAVLGGATQLQGTVNGYGERTGNANLMTCIPNLERSEEQTSELQSLMRIPYAAFCLKTKTKTKK